MRSRLDRLCVKGVAPAEVGAVGQTIRRLVAAGLVAALVAASCGESDDAGDAGPAAPAETAVAATSTTSTSPSTSTAPATTTSSTVSTTTTTLGPGEAPGEIFLEPAGSSGPDPFTGEIYAAPVVPTTAPLATVPTTLEPVVTAQPGQVVVVSQLGNEPGLYGGTRDLGRCDKEGQLQFLLANPDKANAWIAAQNADPGLAWGVPTRTELTFNDLPAYFEELTPVTLLVDTRVTNHGFRDGRPTPRQSVLQAGTAVLVDVWGTPRARCACGNPLTPPRAAPTAPTYVGERWPGFSTEIVIVVQPSTVIIDGFVLVDIQDGTVIIRPAGTTGDADTMPDQPAATTIPPTTVDVTTTSNPPASPPEASTWQVDLEASWVDPAAYNDVTTVIWSANFTIAAHGTITGGGQGAWTYTGECYPGDGAPPTVLAAEGTFTVSISGEAFFTELGRFVTLVPTMGDFVVGSYTAGAACEAELLAGVESWVAQSFSTIEGLQAEADPVLATYVSNGFSGSVTLTPLG